MSVANSATMAEHVDRRFAWAQVRRLFQFSVNPLHELIGFDTRYEAHLKDDAFTFTWKTILRALCKEGKLLKRCLP